MSLTTEKTEMPPIPDLSDPNTFSAAVPHEAFAELQRQPGLHWVPTTVGTQHGGYWAVTRFADIVQIEKDTETFTSTRGANYPSTNAGPDHPAKDMLVWTDPPRHNYLRRAAAKGFAPRVVAKFETWIRQIVTEAIDAVEERDQFDYVEEFGRTIPAYVLGQVLGAPREDREQIVSMATAYFEAGQQSDGLAEGQGTADLAIPAIEALMEYAAKMQQIKLAQPGDDMFTELARCVERSEIDQMEYLQWMHVMIAAGFETTHTAIGRSMRMYLENEEVRELTNKAIDEGNVGRAVDEFFRLISPPMEMARTVTRDTTLAGTSLRKDDLVVMYFIAANRDPSVFAEPDRFDPWRTETDTLAFGSGVHRCIGAHLAKLELSILWEELRKRDIQLELAGTPRRGYSNFINLLMELPVRRVNS